MLIKLCNISEGKLVLTVMTEKLREMWNYRNFLVFVLNDLIITGFLKVVCTVFETIASFWWENVI